MILSKFKDKEARSMQRIYWNCADTVLWLQCAWHCVVLTLCQHFDTMLTLYCADTVLFGTVLYSVLDIVLCWHCANISTLCWHFTDTVLWLQCTDTLLFDTVLWLQCAWHCVVLTLCQHFHTMLTLYCADTVLYSVLTLYMCVEAVQVGPGVCRSRVCRQSQILQYCLVAGQITRTAGPHQPLPSTFNTLLIVKIFCIASFCTVLHNAKVRFCAQSLFM